MIYHAKFHPKDNFNDKGQLMVTKRIEFSDRSLYAVAHNRAWYRLPGPWPRPNLSKKQRLAARRTARAGGAL